MVVEFVRPVALTTRPKVSVVVPCYNYGHHLEELVTRLISGSRVELAILIVDDASPDGSGAVADSLAARYPEVSSLRHQINAGHIQTYNDGLALADGDYVVLLSADDLLPAGALDRAVALMESRPDVGLVYGFSQSFSGEPPEVGDKVRNWSVWAGLDWLSLAARRGRCFIASPEVVMRREALQQTGGYDPRLPHSADFDMWLQTALRWNIGRVNGPPQALYRVHDSNMHLTTFAGMITDLRERRRTFRVLFEEHARDRPDVGRLREPAMKALSREAVKLARIARRDGLSAAAIDPYVQFARETWPAVLRDRDPVAGSMTLPARYLGSFSTKATSHLRWRRWRRYGT